MGLAHAKLGIAIVTGIEGTVATEDPEGIAIAYGWHSSAKGCLGSHLVFADWGYMDFEKEFRGIITVKVDGDKIKPNVWYQCYHGEIVPV